MADGARGQTGWVRLTGGEARARLAGAPVVRLATADADGTPHLVVATFAVDVSAERDRIFTAVDQKPKDSRKLKRLRNIAENPRVTVLADHYEDDWDQLWWVRADGDATVIEDPGGMAAPIRLLEQRYRQYRRNPPGGPVIAISVRRWTGWAFR